MEIEEQARLEAILENAVDAIITIDELGTIEVINPATCRMFGYSQQEILGNNVTLLMPSPFREEHDHVPVIPCLKTVGRVARCPLGFFLDQRQVLRVAAGQQRDEQDAKADADVDDLAGVHCCF